jgi:transcriptional regulator of NAD metabolism
VKRAVQIHRGGKQLDFFRENRIIHDHLLKQAEANNVHVIKTESIETTLEKILAIINKSSTTVNLVNSIDDLEDVINIISKNNGSIEKVTYEIKGFKEPLVRNIGTSDKESADRFIKKINEDESKKEYLSQLYELSEYRKTTICASNQEKLDEIIKELKEKEYVLDE